ncbi:MAG: hypothetical protein JW731_16185 [Bacteroidales bacterium]|nr:hypothetical protein [Bacteroidales bacterium]
MHKPIYIFIIIFLFFTIAQTRSGSYFPVEKEKKASKKQERKARDKYLGFGFGASYLKVTDNATSPLLYKGFSALVSLEYLVHSDKRIKTFETDFGFGWLHSRTETPWYEPRATSYYAAIRYNILYRLKTIIKGNINWYLGPEFNINGHFRVNYKYGNSALTFDNYNGIGLATRFEFPFGYNSGQKNILGMNVRHRSRDLRLSWQLSTPIASFMIRPTYVTITNFIDPDLRTKITTDHTSGGFFIPFNIRSQTEFYYILHNQNMLKLSYIWNFYSHDPGYNKVQSAMHGFLFTFIYKFNLKQ